MNYVIFLPFICGLVEAYNYLVVATLFAHSHVNFVAKIADTLTDAGHNVTFLSIGVAPKYRNVQFVKSTKHVVYIEANDILIESSKGLDNADFSKFWTTDSTFFEVLPTFNFFGQLVKEATINVKNNAHVLDKLKETKYDVIVFEFFNIPAHIIKDYLNIPTMIPTVSVTQCSFLSRLIGEPISPSFQPSEFVASSGSMTFSERLINFFGFLYGYYIFKLPEVELIGKPGQYFNVEEEYPKSPFVFINSNPLVDFARPMISKTIPIGGINVNLEKLKNEKLETAWDNILSKRPHNVLVSFGSLFFSKDMPMPCKKNIVKVMQQFPNTTFIWKYETNDTEFAENADNIHFSKWVPQSALLADSRLSAFLTHAGLGSVNELSYLGKPAILCPLFADQLRNSKMMVRQNGAIEISKYQLDDYQVVKDAVSRILFDDRYKKNAEKLAKMLNEQPFKPKDLVVRNSEFAAEFSSIPAFDPHIREMSFFEYFLIDVAVFLAFLIIITGYISYRLISKFLKVLIKIKQD